jgi:hypothetical protein
MIKRTKYNNRKTVIDDITFDSMKEAKRYSELKLLERAGAISELELQVSFELIPSQKGGMRKELPMRYLADFVYRDLQKPNVPLVIEDVKGVKTKEYVIKRKLMKYNGYEITEI